MDSVVVVVCMCVYQHGEVWLRRREEGRGCAPPPGMIRASHCARSSGVRTRIVVTACLDTFWSIVWCSANAPCSAIMNQSGQEST